MVGCAKGWVVYLWRRRARFEGAFGGVCSAGPENPVVRMHILEHLLRSS